MIRQKSNSAIAADSYLLNLKAKVSQLEQLIANSEFEEGEIERLTLIGLFFSIQCISEEAINDVRTAK